MTSHLPQRDDHCALSPLELKMLRLIFDRATQSGEAEAGRCKLLKSLHRRGPSGHDLIELIQAGPYSDPDCSPPKTSKPDYGLCRMPFGPRKGELFMDLSPYELRSARRWAMRTPELERKFADFIHDAGEFLNHS
jgi:hypothetical protein